MNSSAKADDEPRRSCRHSLGGILLLIALTFFAAWLRFHGLKGHGLWLDEASSVLFARMAAAKFWKIMWRQEGNMLLYYLLLRGWVHVGDTEFLLRIPSVFFGVISVPMIYYLGRDLFSKSTGMIAATVLSVHPFHMFFSQEARGYSQLVLLLLIASWSFVRFTDAPARRLYVFAYPIASALSMYAHLFTILVVGSHWLSLGPIRLRHAGLKRLLGTITAFFFLSLPVEAFALLKSKGRLNWIPPLTVKSFLDAMYSMAGYDYGSLVMLVLSLGLVILAVAAAYRSHSERAIFSARFAALWLILPLATLLLYSIHKPLFYSRYLIICVPALLLLEAEGVAVVKRSGSLLHWLWLPAIILLTGMSFRATWHYFEAPMWPDWSLATQLVLANELPADAVCFNGNGVEPFLYYLQRKTGISWDSLPKVEFSQGVNCVATLPGKPSDANSGCRRVWLITTDPTSQQNDWVMKALVPRYGRPIQRGTFPGDIKIELLPGAAN
jgi:uncharacterized membrane protein